MKSSAEEYVHARITTDELGNVFVKSPLPIPGAVEPEDCLDKINWRAIDRCLQGLSTGFMIYAVIKVLYLVILAILWAVR